MKRENLVLLVVPAIILSILLLSSTSVQNIISAQEQKIKQTNSAKNITVAKNLTASGFNPNQQYTAKDYYKGNSIKIFTVRNMYDPEQWAPIDNYTSTGWEIKSIIPVKVLQPSEKQFLFIILEKVLTR